MRALVVINPIAGPGRTRTLGACVDLATATLTTHHYDADVRITEGPADAYRFSSEAANAKFDLVVAWGGDGTVNGAASGVAGTGIPLAIIPGGSGNGLARDLLIPFDPVAAMTLAATGGVREIDAGDLHGSLFFNVAGIGFDARIADRLAAPGARRGLIGYVLATLGELRTYEPGAYSIHNAVDVEGKQLADILNHRALFIAVANSRQYGNGAQIAPAALLDDGMMELVVVEPQSGFSILKQVPAFFNGTLREGPGLLMRSAASMDISSAHPIRFHVDGEPRTGSESISLRTRRGALAVKGNR
ncbi:MAG: diacylglycerol kinase family protein [Vicinamibacterales bacterium]